MSFVTGGSLSIINQNLAASAVPDPAAPTPQTWADLTDGSGIVHLGPSVTFTATTDKVLLIGQVSGVLVLFAITELYLAITDGSNVLKATTFQADPTTVAEGIGMALSFVLGGLTPGNSYTFKLRMRYSTGGATYTIDPTNASEGASASITAIPVQ